MCGIAGYLNSNQSVDVQLVKRMAHTLLHRGPDDGDVWTEPSAGLALAHRRLSVVELSSAGHQPMHSACGRFVIVFNGEIYNHLSLRAELETAGVAPPWHGHSDTETLLAVLAHWGVMPGLRRLVGMFAFALWDRYAHTLTLARDRMGEKPLYYGWQGNTFLFGSELKALCAHPDFAGEVDLRVLPLYFRHSYIPAPYSIYRGIYKLTPGTFLTLNGTDKEPLQPQTYWSLRDVAETGVAQPFTGDAQDAVDVLERQLRNAIADQMIADVPLGAFLSGGIDSPTVVALMQSLSSRPVRTFTIGFHENGYNEADHAKAIARQLGTEHTELYVTPQEAMAVIPRLARFYDEPFADSSQIPTFLVSQLAREHVTVALSGDGGDELFGGYSRYSKANRFARKFKNIPYSLRSLIAPVLALTPLVRMGDLGIRLEKLSSLLSSNSQSEVYQQFITHWLVNERILFDATEARYLFNDPSQWPCFDDFFDLIMYEDSMTYLPDSVLAKVDRAAMAVSLETRIPMLDHRVVELAWSMPQSIKSQHQNNKWVLRQLLYRYVPQTLLDRPKMGFGVP